MGGKVQAAPGYADHVVFPFPQVCAKCDQRTCVEVCSGQAIAHGDGVPVFDREKCIHCGACPGTAPANAPTAPAAPCWNSRGAGGLHSAENERWRPGAAGSHHIPRKPPPAPTPRPGPPSPTGGDTATALRKGLAPAA
ncbi:MAG: hypothetical protein IPL39_11080 [Opitutaceae bacterium]|nr:hypothetical protein [Opitutaceae bacterium]